MAHVSGSNPPTSSMSMPVQTATLDRLKRAERDPTHRILLKGGIVLSLDPQVGDFAKVGDVFVEMQLTGR